MPQDNESSLVTSEVVTDELQAVGCGSTRIGMAVADLSLSTVHEQCDSGKDLYGAASIDHLQDGDVSPTKSERNMLRRTLGSEWGTSCETSISVYL